MKNLNFEGFRKNREDCTEEGSSMRIKIVKLRIQTLIIVI